MLVAPAPRRTLRAPLTLRGVGVHSGAHAEVTVAPAPFGTGVALRRHGHARDVVPAQIEYVAGGDGATTLALGAARFGTVEHLLAALFGAGVTDADVSVRGAELPILDGSARPWSDAIAAAGTLDGPPGRTLVVRAPVEVQTAGGSARILPCPRCEVAVDVDFGPDGPRGRAEVALEGDRFRDEVSWARTFVLSRDVDRLRAAGRGRGATPENTLVWRPGMTALRAPDEPIRHKLLDAVGDLALLGLPVRGRLEVTRGSHALHHALLRALLADRDATDEIGGP